MFSAATSYFQNRDDNRLRASGQGPYSPVSQLRPGEDQYSAAVRRTTAFDQAAGVNPGRAIGGTGSTGLLPNDAAGWSNLINERNQYTQDRALLAGKAAPTINVVPSTRTVTRSNTTMHPAISGLSTALRGGTSDGGMDFRAMMDTKLARKFAHSSADEMAQGLNDLGLSPLDMMARDNTQYARAVGARDAARDPFTIATEDEDLADLSARRAGQRYNLPEVRGPRTQEFLNKMDLLGRQYVEPAQIKGMADMAGAEAGLAGVRERAGADRDVATSNLRGRQAQALGPMMGMLGKFSELDDQGLSSLMQNPQFAAMLQGLLANINRTQR